MQAFGTKSAFVHSISGPSSDSNDLAIFHSDVQTTAIAAKYASALHPVVRLFIVCLVDTNWPFVFVWCPWPPDVFDGVARLHLWRFTDLDLYHDASFEPFPWRWDGPKRGMCYNALVLFELAVLT